MFKGTSWSAEEIWLEDLRSGVCEAEGTGVLAGIGCNKYSAWFEDMLEEESEELNAGEKRERYIDFFWEDIELLDEIKKLFEEIGNGSNRRRIREEDVGVFWECLREYNRTADIVNSAVRVYGQEEDLVKEIDREWCLEGYKEGVGYRGFEVNEDNEYGASCVDKRSVEYFMKDIAGMNEVEEDKTKSFEEVYLQLTRVIEGEEIDTKDLKVLVDTDIELVRKFGLEGYSEVMKEAREGFVEAVSTGHWAGPALLERSGKENKREIERKAV